MEFLLMKILEVPKRLGRMVRLILGLLLPIFAKAGDLRKLSPGLRWVARIAVLLAFLVGLWFLQRWLGLVKVVEGGHWSVLRTNWLPLLGLLFVTLCWLGWWVWQLLRPEEETAAYPDIDEAWEEAVRALQEAGTEVTGVPLFLVLGRPAGPEEALFQAADLRLTVRQAPRRADAPLHVYAFRDGRYDSAFVTCAGASLLGRQAALVDGLEDAGPAAAGAAAPEGFDAMASMDPFKTARPEGEVKQLLEILREAKRQGRELNDEERQQLKRLERKGRTPLLKNPAEVREATARLKYLCRRIVRDRRPFCPVNGILVLLPWLATDSDDEATQTSTICQLDLAAIREVFQLNCPVLALVCDLERAPGFSAFIERFPADRRKQRLGQRFPLVPDLPASEVPVKIEDGVGWICQSLFPTWIYRFLRLEAPGEATAEAVTRGNAQLVKLLCQMRERQKRLGQLLTRGVASGPNGTPLFGGCYVAGTGADTAQEQAFVPGVFRKLIENQDYVSWTADALAEDAAYHRWAQYGYLGMAVLALGTAALGVIVWLKMKT